ncbi:MAG: DNA primase [Porticoccaceae bacterium]|nr:DNA primase [Pseudomonadales bacterium]MCP5173457.1 DNA primase [Pseudomonadales bacterium]MCP5303270.1 DNA primase [Pseudomonadales bacterium]
MAGRIPQSFIDDLLDRADIVDVVGSRMDLRKSGKNHSACCPFHDEKTPSFTVSAEKQFYYCFGCGAGGNAIGFVMDFDRIDFPEAVERLARHLGLEVPREAARDDGMSQKRKTLQDILQKVDRYYRDQLRQHPQAKSAIEYLKNRGLSGEIARDFGMGYAPPGWDNLLLALGKDDTALALLKEGGMLVDREEENKLYDRFRHRIMFPIRDVRGRTIGFGGRVLDDSKPKYLNSPETPLFHKGRELYGLYEANQKLRDIPNLVVVEGYMDVVALAQHNIHNAVATLGTAATPEHLDKLFRYTAEVVFCFDGDNAGRKAARRALETTLPAMLDGRTVRFLFLPDGEDPDTLVRKIGTADFNNMIRGAQPISAFLFDNLAEGIDTDSLDGKARLSKLAAPLINRIPEGVFKALMLQSLSEKTGVDRDTLKSFITPAKTSPLHIETPPEWESNSPDQYHEIPDYYGSDIDGDTQDDNQNPYTQQRPAPKIKLPAERALIALICNHPQLSQMISDDDLVTLRSLDHDDLNIFANLVTLLKEHPDYTVNHILGYWRGMHSQHEAELLAEIAATDLLNPVKNSTRNNDKEFQDTLARVKKRAIEQLPPKTLLELLASQDNVDDFELKRANNAWLQIPEDQRNDEVRLRFRQIHSKAPRRGQKL